MRRERDDWRKLLTKVSIGNDKLNFDRDTTELIFTGNPQQILGTICELAKGNQSKFGIWNAKGTLRPHAN